MDTKLRSLSIEGTVFRETELVQNHIFDSGKL